MISPRNPLNQSLSEGTTQAHTGAFDAFIWKNGVMTDIAQGSGNGGAEAYATGINQQGEVVGTNDEGPSLYPRLAPYPWGFPHAYVSRNGVRTDLGTLNGDNINYSYGIGIKAEQALNVLDFPAKAEKRRQPK